MSNEKSIVNITDKDYEVQTIAFKVESSTPYDDTFRALLEDLRWMAIPVINEIFGTDYGLEEKIELLQNEMYISEDRKGYYKRVTDSRIRIRDKIFHLECQSTSDNTMVIRMAEYDFLIARSGHNIDENILTLVYPYSAILYLRSTRNTPDEMVVQFHFPESEDYSSYKIPVIRMQSYSIEDIFEKKLMFLLPFYIFNFEKEMPEYEMDRKKQELLVAEYHKISRKLTKWMYMGVITEGEKLSLLELSNCVIDSLIGRKAPTVAERIGDIMGGTAMDYPTKRILKEGYEKGKKDGIEEGIEQGIEQGITEILIQLVKDGLLSVSEAARRMHVSESSFESLL
ncbi:MAG: hypothetical protein LUF92_02685 [Clostridiales bacterium]|nr:hypothetical protein [Clostridiales bacterium]